MADMKGITCCGDCIYYDWKKKRCKRGASQDDDPKGPFFADCPLPSVEPERPKGRWEYGYNCGQYGVWCSECKTGFAQSETYTVLAAKHKYCPNCGADMRESESE